MTTSTRGALKGTGAAAVPQPAPAPALAVSGTRVTLTGVRYSWSLRCWKCREVTSLPADGGKILAGLDASKKTVRWYETWKAPAMPARPERCPECGETDRPFAYPCDREPLPDSGSTLPVLNEVWAALRAGFPALAAKADAAMKAA